MRFGVLLLILLATVLTGCQSAPPDEPTTTAASSSVSAIPWNKPASWEGAGALGGFMPQGGH